MEALPIETRISQQGRRIDRILDELLPRDAPAFLAEPMWYHLDTGGKRVRPALCLMTCDALGGDSEDALHFAAAVEILHNMLLVHDDIEDDDAVRRDQSTVWKKYGVANAINVGDYLLGRALTAVMQSPLESGMIRRLLEVFVATYERTVEGQALDINARCDRHFSVERYLEMARLKTGHYLVLGMVGAAIIAGAPEVTIQCLQRLGESMGPAFQIRDDLIDLTTGKGRGGDTGGDIREGKASILYAHAVAHSMPEEMERLAAIMAKPRDETTDADVRDITDLYERCGSITFAEETVDGLIRQAHEVLEYLPIEQQTPLKELVTFMAERTR